MAAWIVSEMELLGIDTRLKHLGKEEGTELDLPPIVTGRLGTDPAKPTILVYSHYDVQPASVHDGWDHDPWDLTIDADGTMHGRGTSDDKGPLLNWLNTIEAFRHAGEEIPVNILFCFEGMEESGSIGFRSAVKDEATVYFRDVDAVCITDTVWASDTQPSVTRGLRGVLFYVLSIAGAEKDAHSGGFGGAISEPMTDMVNIMASLVDSKGKLLIPGVYDAIHIVTEEERESYRKMNITKEALAGGAGGRCLHEGQADMLISR